MALSDLKIAPGRWLVANCADYPSDKNCQLVIMAPTDQREDLNEAAVAHFVSVHGHQDSADLRNGLAGVIREVDV